MHFEKQEISLGPFLLSQPIYLRPGGAREDGGSPAYNGRYSMPHFPHAWWCTTIGCTISQTLTSASAKAPAQRSRYSLARQALRLFRRRCGYHRTDDLAVVLYLSCSFGHKLAQHTLYDGGKYIRSPVFRDARLSRPVHSCF